MCRRDARARSRLALALEPLGILRCISNRGEGGNENLLSLMKTFLGSEAAPEAGVRIGRPAGIGSQAGRIDRHLLSEERLGGGVILYWPLAEIRREAANGGTDSPVVRGLMPALDHNPLTKQRLRFRPLFLIRERTGEVGGRGGGGPVCFAERRAADRERLPITRPLPRF